MIANESSSYVSLEDLRDDKSASWVMHMWASFFSSCGCNNKRKENTLAINTALPDRQIIPPPAHKENYLSPSVSGSSIVETPFHQVHNNKR